MNSTLSIAERERILQMARAAKLERSAPKTSAIERADREGRIPLSFAQQRLWFLEQLGDLGSTYHIRKRRRLRGAVDRAALVRALDAIVARHEALRTTFAQVDGVPEQRIAPAESSPFHLVEHDLEGRADAKAEFDRVAAEEAHAPFDLERGPLVRGRLIRLASDDHVLLVTMHHIVSDAWSSEVFFSEFSALYAAFREGREANLPELPVQYADYSVWQRRWIEGEVLQAQADYWTGALTGAPELLELPTDHPRPVEQSHAGAQLGVELDAELTAGLNALSRRHGTTLFMTLLAGWAVVLGRLAGQGDVVVGSPIAGRGRREIEGLIGFFVNTLALRVDLSGAPTVAELLGRVKQRVLDAQHHQDIPFEQVVELIDPVRSLSHHPLFQVMLVWQNATPGGGSEAARGDGGAGMEAAQAQATFDLSLALRETGGRIAGSITYATSLFDRATVERHVDYLRRVLAEMASDDGARVDRLALVPSAERVRVVEEWNRTDAPYAAESCIHELFEAQAARAPDALALGCSDVHLSYGELNARANRLAHHLRSLGVGPDARVAICVERGVEMIVALLAVLKAGGAYVPLDPDYPRERLAWMLEDSAPALLLTQRHLRDRVDADALPVVDLDDADAWSNQPSTNPNRDGLTPNHLAYLIYTSGSTGLPKGAMIQHRNVCGMVSGQIERLPFEGEARVLQFASFGFDGCVYEVFLALARGASLHLSDQPGVLAGDHLIRTVADAGITHAILPPAVLAALPEGERLPTIHTLIVSGDAPGAELMARWSEGRRLINGYGPTEATVCTTLHDYRPVPTVPPIGRPVANVRVYLLDASGEPVPQGSIGELHIGGATVGRGYWRRPELTAERFVPDPFGAPGARLYRTGDLARWNSAGELEFAGRADAQVKVRGFRIELGEIEARLLEHAEVREAVVVARGEGASAKRLVAYWVGEGVEPEALRIHLLERLPEHMVPAAYVHLPELPLNRNGKVDRRALPAPEGDAYARRGYEAPRTETEVVLAQIWSEVLKVERVGRHDGFFELGGHSLLAVTLIERMRRQGLHADVRTLFASPTLAALAAAVGGESAEVEVPANGIVPGCDAITPEMLPLVTLSQAEVDAIVATVPGGAANVQDIYPLAPLQEGLLFHHLLTADGDPYLLGNIARFATRERLDAYLDALRAVIARHDVLRTSIVWEDLPEPVQVVWRDAPLLVQELELDPADGDVAGQLYRRFDPRHYRMDVRRAPMMSVHVAREVGERWVLLLLRHHLIGDHTATEVLRSEIEAHLSGRADTLPEPLPFRNYVAQVRLGVSQEEHRAFFTELLGDVDEPTAPFGLLDVRGDGSGIDEARLVVEDGLAARLRERARALGVSAASVFHVAWAQVLARTSGRDDVVFGTVLFGRMQGGEGADRTMGPFINTLPIRIHLAEAGAEASVRETHALLARLLRHEHASLALAQRCSAVEASAPLFTSLLNYRHSVGTARSTPASSDGRRKNYGGERSNYPFDLLVDDLGTGGFTLEAQVLAGVGADRVCALMHTALEGLADALERAPGRRVLGLPVLPAAERERVVEAWNRTETAFPRDVCLHALFEAQAARAPDADAVVFDGGVLTYGELNARANRLAHHLVRMGVGPDTRVALCAERGPEMVVAVFAVLKAGGAYVPLDPAYPVDRLRAMLRESAPVAMLIQDHLQERLHALLAEIDPGMPILRLEADAAAWAELPETDPVRPALRPEHLAYVVFTSGSTGTPKGVMVEHRSVCNQVLAVQRAFGLGPGDRVLQFAPVAFDISVEEIFGALGSGAALVLRDDGWLEGARAFWERCERHGVTFMDIPARFWQLLLDDAASIPPCVRLIVTGGEAIERAALRSWFGRDGHRPRLFIACGPTETTIDATLQEAVDEDSAWRALGGPMANTRAYVLDAHGEPVPVGVTGEIYIGGVQVTRGYLGRPDLTAEKFVPDPFGAPGGRLYRSGDLGRWRPEGTIQFAGRADFQVKLRGFRVELGEIEARLAEHPDVRQAVVLAREDEPGEKRLVAYVVGDDSIGADVLRAYLADILPEYMVPAAYVRLDTLPLMPNGKLDRRALPAPEGDAFAAAAYEAPAGETEAVLAGIWAEVLGVERVGRQDNFFELGGHSLLAVQVISRVRQALGVDVELGELFARPTLADLARSLETATQAELPPIEPAPREGRMPLSFAQQRLWFMEQLGNMGGTYHIPWRLRLRGELDGAALLRALDRVVARHEALRTTFAQVDGVPEQRVTPADESGFDLVEHDLAGIDGAEAERNRLMAEEARAPFDLERGPLIRGRLIRMAEDDHVLLVTMHHIVSDGWSADVLTHEISILYAAFRRGEPDPLPPLAVQYADYAAWQRRWVEGDVLRRQADYWARTLAGAPELLELPTDHPRPAQVSHAGAQLRVALDEALTAGVRALSRRHGTTTFMTVLAAWAAVLGRLSGQDDVVLGTPTANRGRREIEGLIGFFVGTLALRVDLSGGPTVAELLARVKERVLQAQHHQDIPFEQVVERVDPVRSLSHSPLFQVMFAWQNEVQGGGGLALPGVELGGVGGGAESAQVPAKFDLSLTLREAGDRIVGSVVYVTALWERETVKRFVGYLRRALEAMVADDRRPVDRLPLLPEAERVRVLEEWNGPAAAYPRDACVHDLFEAQAARTPDAEAVVFEGARLTYAELDARANRLANHLRALGVGPDVRVGICVERSLEMVVGMMAILKAGGGYVPLDPSYPAERLAYMLENSAPAAVLTQKRLRGRVEGTGAPVLELDAANPAWAQLPATPPSRGELTPGHLAYMTYTSGSTGRPKGVANPHRGSVNRLAWFQARHALGAGEGVLQNSSFSFDASVFEIFWPLAVGGRLVIPRPEGHRDPEYLIRLIRGEGVTTAYFVCSMLQLFLEYEGVEQCTGLARLLCGGEALSPVLAQRVRERLPRVRLHNLYGPTESAVSVTGEVLAQDASVGSVPIGRPAPNVRVYLLDEWGEPVPVGVAGEIHVGGAQLARGYLDRPELTAERFVADPYVGEAGARLYRTGDRARWRSDGRIEFLGRMDFQVKVRGFRIEPGEIEERLKEHPGVREAVILAREDTPGDVRLAAYWIGEAVDAESLRKHLGEALPAYMVPSAFVRLERFPLSPNGKLDRAALPAPEGDAFAAREYEAPVGETEQAVAAIWGEVLRVERVGRGDAFFDLGGHSLLAVQVISRVRQVLGVDVALGELFTRPVLRDFARELKTAARVEVRPIEPAPREGRIPLSFAQERLWFLEQLEELGAAYHIRRRVPFRGEFDRSALVRALDAIVARHEALRTTFAQVDGVPEQRIAPADVGFLLREDDLGGRVDAKAELDRLVAEETRAPFDLARGPLIRGRLVRLAADHHVLVLTMHHIVSDGWSMGVLTQELSALYRAFRRGAGNPLPALPVQYADYAAWQRRWVAGEVLQAQADYWKRTLAGAPELLELPTDHRRPARMDHAGAQFGVELDAELTAGLRALGRRHGTTLFMTLLAAWSVVLGRLAGREDVVVGSPTAGRGRREIEGLIGFFVNTLALRVDLADGPTVAELLARVKERTLEAQHHQDIPFEQVVDLVDPARSLSHTPLFQVMLTWLDTPRGSRQLAVPDADGGDGGAPGTESSNVQSQFDLSLALGEKDGRIAGGVMYRTSLFERATVERFVGYLRRVLEGMVADDGQRIEHLSLLPSDERARVVDAWNRTDAAYPSTSCIHQLFEAQVERTPDAPAVAFEGRHVTYAELNARANRLAHHLRALGVGPDVRVGICAERTPAMVVGLLAVLKAGGAYVPLDPSYPEERLRWMIEDSAPAVLLAGRRLADRFDWIDVPVEVLDAEAPAWASRPATNPSSGGSLADGSSADGVTSEHLAYVIFTSGSTGRPKGVAIAHRNTVNLLEWARSAFTDADIERTLFSTSLNFDLAVFELFVPLTRGATACLVEDAVALLQSPTDVTLINTVPSAMRALLDGGGLPASVRTVNLAGEPLKESLAERIFAETGVERLCNLYGPSETTTYSTGVAMPRRDGFTPHIGTPLLNTRTYILDASLEPVPVGVAGELHIGGAGLARGYLGRPDQTADRFVADPFGEPGLRLYRTGDLARWRPDGTIEYLGRTDHQVKVRGFRIELGEIEARLVEHAAVREAVVLAREDAPGEKRLVAYVVAPEDVGAEVLRSHLSERLPEYMVPAAYVRLGALPLTPNGKLDRKALPAPEGGAYSARAFEAPLGEIEEGLAEIWTELLGVSRVGRWDNFFDLGGHSLLAVQLVSRVRQGMEVELALGAVFEKPVLSALADQVLDLQLARFDPETLAQLAELVREHGAEGALAREDPG